MPFSLEDFGLAVRLVRTKKAMSHCHLGDATGIPDERISAIETVDAAPLLAEAVEISNALGMGDVGLMVAASRIAAAFKNIDLDGTPAAPAPAPAKRTRPRPSKRFLVAVIDPSGRMYEDMHAAAKAEGVSPDGIYTRIRRGQWRTVGGYAKAYANGHAAGLAAL